ncbi:MAG TPA: Maf family protein [Candidatus Acidoferrales bacterium]|nr:Maf family protein [Candidatus Acidoferrales bacterium]
MKLILASASPRRAEILTNAGLTFETHSADVDESRRTKESPADLVERLALAKAQAVADRSPIAEPTIVIGADTIVVVEDDILGKPGTSAVARDMLRRLGGREHAVITGVALAVLSAGPAPLAYTTRVEHEITRVWFSPMNSKEIDDYVATGEPLDKAGSYAIQGLAGRFIPRIEGCYFNVVGLPLARVWRMLAEANFCAAEK